MTTRGDRATKAALHNRIRRAFTWMYLSNFACEKIERFIRREVKRAVEEEREAFQARETIYLKRIDEAQALITKLGNEVTMLRRMRARGKR